VASLISRGAAQVNSQGRKPLVTGVAAPQAPQGAKAVVALASLSPLARLPADGDGFQGLTPLAIDFRRSAAKKRRVNAREVVTKNPPQVPRRTGAVDSSVTTRLPPLLLQQIQIAARDGAVGEVVRIAGLVEGCLEDGAGAFRVA
jgi:hypothetical protein